MNKEVGGGGLVNLTLSCELAHTTEPLNQDTGHSQPHGSSLWSPRNGPPWLQTSLTLLVFYSNQIQSKRMSRRHGGLSPSRMSSRPGLPEALSGPQPICPFHGRASRGWRRFSLARGPGPSGQNSELTSFLTDQPPPLISVGHGGDMTCPTADGPAPLPTPRGGPSTQ